jgi:hypothetical protein
MEPEMFQAFMFSLLTFSFVFVTLLWHRFRLQARTERLEQRKMSMLSE